MGMVAARDLWTVDMLDALPDDGQRYELIDGVVHVTPAPSDVLLAIEIESPGNPLYDYHTKRELYLTHGVPEYWVVNADARVVSRWRNLDDPGEVFSERMAWHPPGLSAPLVLELPAVFEDALG